MLAGLPELGVTKFAPPDGAFFLYADVSHLTNDSVAFCRQLLDATGVAITPGVDFDPVRGATSIRMSYARDAETIKAAMERMAAFVRD